VIEFAGVRDLRISELGGGPRQIMGFSIEDIRDRGLEGIAFDVEDYENGVIAFQCRTARLSAVEPARADWLP
jgi:hypothetical protein